MPLLRFLDRVPSILVLVVLVIFLVESWTPRPHIDDAYISYRYARNLVEGNGLVYNIGERVEGFTNLLWTLLVAAGMALGGSAPLVAHALGVASGAAALIAAYAYACAGLGSSHRWIAAAAPVLLYAWIGFPIWTLSGLETPLFAAAVGWALAAEMHGRIGLATSASMIATLCRPEGALLAAVILLVNALRGPTHRRRVVAWGLVYALFIGLLTGFRLYYYGSPLPNTFYAKTGHSAWLPGLSYLWVFLVSGALLLLVPAVWTIRRDRRSWVGAIWALAMAFYIVSVGGDAFPFHRFWVPVYLILAALAARALVLQRQIGRGFARELPLWAFVVAAGAWSFVSFGAAVVVLATLTLAGMASVRGRSARRRTVSFALILAPLLLLWCTAPWLDDAEFARRGAHIARWIGSSIPSPGASRTETLLALGRPRIGSRQHTLREVWNGRALHLARAQAAAKRINDRIEKGEPVRLVAAGAIGKFGYDLRVPILDMLGLVDAQIARSPPYIPKVPVAWVPGHTHTNSAYVFSRQPDYIILQKRSKILLRLPLHVDMWNNPTLEADYEFEERMQAFRRRALPRPRARMQ